MIIGILVVFDVKTILKSIHTIGTSIKLFLRVCRILVYKYIHKDPIESPKGFDTGPFSMVLYCTEPFIIIFPLS